MKNIFLFLLLLMSVGSYAQSPINLKTQTNISDYIGDELEGRLIDTLSSLSDTTTAVNEIGRIAHVMDIDQKWTVNSAGSWEVLSGGTDDQTAAEVPTTPTGNFTSTDVQSGFEEHQSDIDQLNIDVTTLQNNQTAGLIGYPDKATMDADATQAINTVARVADDATASNNGYYRYTGAAWVKQADLYDNTLEEDNTTQAVTGKAVSDWYDTVNPIGLFGANRIDTSLVQDAWYNNSDGNEIFSTLFHGTGKQRVEPGESYVLWNDGEQLYSALHYWDINGVWLGNNLAESPYIGNSTFINGVHTISSVPSGAYFISCNSGVNPTQTLEEFKNTLMLELGGTKSQSYISPSIALNPELLTATFSGNISEDNLEQSVSDLSYAKLSQVDSMISTTQQQIRVHRSGNTVFVTANYVDTADIRHQFNGLYGTSDRVVITSSTMISKNTNYQELITASGDDIAPANFNGTYIGANHGCSDVIEITSTSHGKTNVDVGSQYVDEAGVNFYIVKIIDADRLWVLSENSSANDIWNFTTTVTGNLTHVANGTNTSQIIVNSVVQSQLLPALKNGKRQIFLNNKLITSELLADTSYYCNNVKVVDSYDIVDPASTLDSLIANVGSPNPDLLAGDTVVGFRIIYEIDTLSGNFLVHHDFKVYKDIALGYLGGIQVGAPIANPDYPNFQYYVPATNPITVGAETYDFSAVDTLGVGQPVGSVAFTSATWENPDYPPERFVSFNADANNVRRHALAHGYLPVASADTSQRKNLIDQAAFLYTSKKSYPHLVTGGTVPAGSFYSTVAYRRFIFAPETGPETLSYHIQSGGYIYVYLDYHTQVDFDTYELPYPIVGNQVEILYKSSNMTIHSSVVGQEGITISTSDANNAYACLKIKL